MIINESKIWATSVQVGDTIIDGKQRHTIVAIVKKGEHLEFTDSAGDTFSLDSHDQVEKV